jgi:hypothetical protein
MVSASLYTANLEYPSGGNNASAYSCIVVDGVICGSNATLGPGHSAGVSSSCITKLLKGTHQINFEGYDTSGLMTYSGTLVIWPI